MKKLRAVVLIDGEHYPPVVQEAIDAVRAEGAVEIVAACFLGGTEKIGSLDELSLDVPILANGTLIELARRAVHEFAPDVAIDLSDEPVVGYEERLLLASFFAAQGVDYLGSDFRFAAPTFEEAATKPSLGIIGTGKRVGKTAVSAHTARLLKEWGRKPVVVAMGRGGPKDPVVLDGESILIDNAFLLELKEKGLHAASDYVEDAMMSRVTTIGCRRCGGGLLGQPFVTNVPEGVRVANTLEADIILVEGSGSAIPPVMADAYVTVASLIEPETHVTGYLGPFRLFISSALVLTNCETSDDRRMFERIQKEAQRQNPDIEVVGTIFRPRALEPLRGEKVFLATTAHPDHLEKIARHLEQTENCEVVFASSSLSNRGRLREELEARKKDFTAIAMELKAASVDVCLSYAIETGRRAVFFDNIPHSVAGERTYEDIVRDIDARLFSKQER